MKSITITTALCIVAALSSVQMTEAHPKDNLVKEIKLQARGNCFSCTRKPAQNNDNNHIPLQPLPSQNNPMQPAPAGFGNPQLHALQNAPPLQPHQVQAPPPRPDSGVFVD